MGVVEYRLRAIMLENMPSHPMPNVSHMSSLGNQKNIWLMQWPIKHHQDTEGFPGVSRCGARSIGSSLVLCLQAQVVAPRCLRWPVRVSLLFSHWHPRDLKKLILVWSVWSLFDLHPSIVSLGEETIRRKVAKRLHSFRLMPGFAAAPSCKTHRQSLTSRIKSNQVVTWPKALHSKQVRMSMIITQSAGGTRSSYQIWQIRELNGLFKGVFNWTPDWVL